MQNVWKEGGRGGEKGQQIFHSAAVESKSHRWHGKGEGIVVVRGASKRGRKELEEPSPPLRGREGRGRQFPLSSKEEVRRAGKWKTHFSSLPPFPSHGARKCHSANPPSFRPPTFLLLHPLLLWCLLCVCVRPLPPSPNRENERTFSIWKRKRRGERGSVRGKTERTKNGEGKNHRPRPPVLLLSFVRWGNLADTHLRSLSSSSPH